MKKNQVLYNPEFKGKKFNNDPDEMVNDKPDIKPYMPSAPPK